MIIKEWGDIVKENETGGIKEGEGEWETCMCNG